MQGFLAIIIRQIRGSNASYKYIPIIAMTNYELSGGKENFFECRHEYLSLQTYRLQSVFSGIGSRVVNNKSKRQLGLTQWK